MRFMYLKNPGGGGPPPGGSITLTQTYTRPGWYNYRSVGSGLIRNQPIGAADPGRLVVIAHNWIHDGEIDYVEINGSIICTTVQSSGSNQGAVVWDNTRSAISYAVVPTGTEMDFEVFSVSTNCSYASHAIYTLIGADNTGHNDSFTDNKSTGTALPGTLDVSGNGAVIACAVSGNNTRNFTWDNLTQDFTTDGTEHAYAVAVANGLAANAAYGIGGDWDVSDECNILAVSFDAA